MTSRVENRGTGRRRAGRPSRVAGSLQQAPFRQVSMPYAPIEVLSSDRIEAIHDAGLTILETIGIRVLDARARSSLWRCRRGSR